MVIFWGGSTIDSFDVVPTASNVSPPFPNDTLSELRIAEITVDVVCSKICRASVGDLVTYRHQNHFREVGSRGYRRTARVPEFGAFITPNMMAFHRSSPGISGSVQKMVNRGESHRAMDEGSSKRRIRWSRLNNPAVNLCLTLNSNTKNTRFWIITLSVLNIPFPADTGGCCGVKLLQVSYLRQHGRRERTVVTRSFHSLAAQ